MAVARALPGILGLCVFALLAACTPRQPYPLPERPDIPFGQGRLWQVEGEGLATSYVFGTFQILDRRLLELPGPVERAFVNSKVLALEDFGSLYDDDGIFNVGSLELPEGESLQTLIGARSFGILTWHFKRSELRPKDNVKPWPFWVAMRGLSWGFFDYTSYYDYRGDVTLADSLKQRARREGKRVIDLETVHERFDILDKMPLAAQADMLQVGLDRYSKREPRVPEAELYLNGDLARLDALWREFLGWHRADTAAVLDDRLINDRNPILLERMLPLMREGPTFVSVDVRHLPGGEGILRLLERRGYTVTRLH